MHLVSTTDGDAQAKFVFKARYGATPSSPVRSEASHEEIDAFVKEILGVDRTKKNQP